MSKKYNKVKEYYEKGLWNEERVANAVLKGWITTEEFREITGVKNEKQLSPRVCCVFFAFLDPICSYFVF